MADEETTEEQTEEEAEEAKKSSQKIMCFVSKKMVPLNETVEIEYAPGKKVRVLPKYVKYDQETA